MKQKKRGAGKSPGTQACLRIGGSWARGSIKAKNLHLLEPAKQNVGKG